MRYFRNSLFVLATVFGLAAVAGANSADAPKSNDAPKELKHQTVCPVMGGKIDSTAFTDIQGQRVYHCCPMCSAKLKADPDKYFEQSANDGILFENVQTTCPVSGDSLENKSTYVDYKGRRIYFCCEDCIARFDKNPEKYLKSMDSGDKSESGDMKKMDHDSHMH